MANRSKSSKRWLKEHFKDKYVQQAHAAGLRSRAVFKLSELDEKYRLLKPGMTVVDLGAAPGGWSVYAKDKVGDKGEVFALDLLEVKQIPGVNFIQGDFLEERVYQELLTRLAGKPVDVVLSDIAPNASGVMAVDQARSMYLAECAFEFCQRVLKPGGCFVIKIFQGEGFDVYLRQLKTFFARSTVKKPKASRDRSREYYLLGLDFKHTTDKS